MTKANYRKTARTRDPDRDNESWVEFLFLDLARIEIRIVGLASQTAKLSYLGDNIPRDWQEGLIRFIGSLEFVWYRAKKVELAKQISKNGDTRLCLYTYTRCSLAHSAC